MLRATFLMTALQGHACADCPQQASGNTQIANHTLRLPRRPCDYWHTSLTRSSSRSTPLGNTSGRLHTLRHAENNRMCRLAAASGPETLGTSQETAGISETPPTGP
jgi:hypothetical protein